MQGCAVEGWGGGRSHKWVWKAEWHESWKWLDQWWQQNWVWQWCKGQSNSLNTQDCRQTNEYRYFLLNLHLSLILKKQKDKTKQKYPRKMKILIKFKGYILWSNPLTMKYEVIHFFLSSHEPNFFLLHLQQGKKRDKPRPQGSGGFGLLPPPPGGKIAPPPSSGLSNHNIVPQTGSTATGMQTDFI